MTSRYRFAGPLLVRLLGLGLAGTGVLLLVLIGLVALLSLPGVVVTAAVLVAGLALLLLVLLGVVATRRAVVVRFDEAGYRIRFVRGAGVRQAEWKQVEDVAATTLGGARCVVLRLRDGRTSTVPVGLLAADADDFVGDLRAHLDRGHGYRSLGGRR